MQQAVDYLLKVRPQLSSLLASYNMTCYFVGTADDSFWLRHKWVQQRGALMTGLTSIQANFAVIIEAQHKRTCREATLFQLCSYYLAFFDFALHSLQRGHRLLAAFPELQREKFEEPRNFELDNPISQATYPTPDVISEKERADLIADLTTIKLFRNTVKLLRNRLNSGNAVANKVPQLFPIAQAIITRHRDPRTYCNSTSSGTSFETQCDYTNTNESIRNLIKSLWVRVENKKLLTFSLSIVAGALVTILFVITFVFTTIGFEKANH